MAWPPTTHQDVKDKIDEVEAAARQVLDVAELATTQSTSSASAVDVVGLAVTVTAIGRPIVLTFDGLVTNNTAGKASNIFITEGSTVIGSYAATAVGTADYWNAHKEVELAGDRLPSVGTHTYKVQMLASTGGTMTLYASVADRALFRAEQL